MRQYFEEKFQERNKSYQSLYAGSTFDASGNIIPVVQTSENFTAQNSEFITFRREIGTQMGLSLYESDSLSPEEVQIL